MTKYVEGCYWCANFKKCSHISEKVKKSLRDGEEGYREIYGIQCQSFSSKKISKEEVEFT
jgi:hypothetical protein